jgi:threonine dehydratase
VTNMPNATQPLPSLQDIQQAATRIAPHIHTTPILRSQLINQLAGCSLSFKCEHLQRAGAFKARGAFNAVLQLSDQQASQGVATHSSGNHGAALAMAAKSRNIPAFIVMPNNAPQVKQQAVAAYGAKLIHCQPGLAARQAALAEVTAASGSLFIPPYEHLDIICGQGTVGLELLDQLKDSPPDVVITPVGGGGLLAGVATAVKSIHPTCQVIGAEPAAADDAHRSYHSGTRVEQHKPNSIADGLLTTLGAVNFEIIRQQVDDILLVSEEQIIDAMQLVWTRMKQLIEPSAAVPLAAVLANAEHFKGQHVAIVLSGGNVDLNKLPW